MAHVTFDELVRATRPKPPALPSRVWDILGGLDRLLSRGSPDSDLRGIESALGQYAEHRTVYQKQAREYPKHRRRYLATDHSLVEQKRFLAAHVNELKKSWADMLDAHEEVLMNINASRSASVMRPLPRFAISLVETACRNAVPELERGTRHYKHYSLAIGAEEDRDIPRHAGSRFIYDEEGADPPTRTVAAAGRPGPQHRPRHHRAETIGSPRELERTTSGETTPPQQEARDRHNRRKSHVP